MFGVKSSHDSSAYEVSNAETGHCFELATNNHYHTTRIQIRTERIYTRCISNISLYVPQEKKKIRPCSPNLSLHFGGGELNSPLTNIKPPSLLCAPPGSPLTSTNKHFANMCYVFHIILTMNSHCSFTQH
jgi:hypothetical protein